MFKESITSGIHRGDHHIWTPPAHLSATETYMFGILDEGTNDFGYSPTFMVLGGVVPDLKMRAVNSTSNDTSSIVSSAPKSAGLGTPTSTSTSSEAPTTSPGATDLPQRTNSSDPSSSGLSTGAKAGIGVGAGVGGLFLLAGLVYLIRQRRSGAGAGTGATGVYAAEGTTATTQVQPFPSELAAGGDERLQRVELQG
ncbi:hypothetical protein V8F20_009408 [Naviculisporaceae sp. PSN 640]